ncbi:MAG: ABC transporter substrate-binding protein [Holosporales bacterium]|jgi:phospholipid transport system substrate-binding protein|nr:ABC transporter substrate-binding protein [Holosporales bacterium]
MKYKRLFSREKSLVKNPRVLFYVMAAIGMLVKQATLFGTPPPAETATTSAQAQRFVADFGNRAISALTDPKISTSVRQERFSILLEEGFDVETIGRFVLARHWHRLTDIQKKRFLDLFRRTITINYAARFKEFVGLEMHVKSAEYTAQGGINVKTIITPPRGGQVMVVWKTFPASGSNKFKVVDVTLDNVSMSITQRSEFAHSIQKLGDSMDAFLTDLEQRVQRTHQKTS